MQQPEQNSKKIETAEIIDINEQEIEIFTKNLFQTYEQLASDINQYFNILEYHHKNTTDQNIKPHKQQIKTLNLDTKIYSPEYQKKLTENDLYYITQKFHRFIQNLSSEIVNIQDVQQSVWQKQRELDEVFQSKHRQLNMIGLLGSIITLYFDIKTKNIIGESLSAIALMGEGVISFKHNREFINPLIKIIPLKIKEKIKAVSPRLKEAFDENKKSLKINSLRLATFVVIASLLSSVGSQVINGMPTAIKHRSYIEKKYEPDNDTKSSDELLEIAQNETNHPIQKHWRNLYHKLEELGLIDTQHLNDIHAQSTLIYKSMNNNNKDKIIKFLLGLDQDKSYIIGPYNPAITAVDEAIEIMTPIAQYNSHKVSIINKSGYIYFNIDNENPNNIKDILTEGQQAVHLMHIPNEKNILCQHNQDNIFFSMPSAKIFSGWFAGYECNCDQPSLEIYANTIIYSSMIAFLTLALEMGMLCWFTYQYFKSQRHKKKTKKDIGLLNMPKYLTELKKIIDTLNIALNNQEQNTIDLKIICQKLNMVLNLINQSPDNPFKANFKNIIISAIIKTKTQIETSETYKPKRPKENRINKLQERIIDKTQRVLKRIYNRKNDITTTKKEITPINNLKSAEEKDIICASDFFKPLNLNTLERILKQMGIIIDSKQGKGSHKKMTTANGQGKSAPISNRDQYEGKIIMSIIEELNLDPEQFYEIYLEEVAPNKSIKESLIAKKKNGKKRHEHINHEKQPVNSNRLLD